MNSFYNDVNDWLSVGGDLDLARDVTGQDFQTTIAHLQARGVTHVLDLRSEWSDLSEWTGMGLDDRNYAHIPIVDHWGYTPDEAWFGAVEDFVERFWLESNDGDRLYVHCHMGINRAPSAAMLALLTVDPLLTPMDAFMQIRSARPIAGLVYAEAVGIRHLLNAENITAEDMLASGELPASVRLFSAAMRNYWTPELRQACNRGIAFYRSKEGGTIKVGGQPVLGCPADPTHRAKWNGGDPTCLDCGTPAVSLRLDSANSPAV